MSVINTQPLIGASGQGGAYNLTKSLRFRKAANAYLSRTPSSTGNRKTFTYSFWVKRAATGVSLGLLSCSVGDNNNKNEWAFNDDKLFFELKTPSATYAVTTTQLFRDYSAWYHVVVAVDTTQATASNRMKIYVNGSQVTSFSTADYPPQNADNYINTTNAHTIGQGNIYGGGALYFDGYMTEINFVDGQQLTATSFGEFDTITGVWKPKRFSGTYGTNGFYLPFTDVATTSGSNAGLGKDFSGNGNYFNTNNISVTAGVTYDSMTDVPTLTSATASNYPTLNPLVSNAYIAASNGNLTATSTTNNVALIPSTMAFPPGGKYYFELTCQTAIGSNFYQSIGIWGTHQFSSYFTTSDSTYYSYGAIDGKKYNAGASATYGATWTNGDVVAAALDLVNGTITFYKNGVSQGVAYTGLDTTVSYYAATYCYTTQCSLNFGQRPFAYTPPTGYVALNAYNLPDSTIVAGNKVMDATTYTGDATTPRNVTNSAGFKPDFVWIKNRTNITNHILTDSVRGATQTLFSDLTNAELTVAEGLKAFNSNGFQVGFSSGSNIVNNTGNNYVAWQWQAGQGTTSSNTSGSITSTVSANPTAGFSIVTYTGTGANATVGHGLGIAPKFIIIKNRTASGQEWQTLHMSANNGAGYLGALFLNLTAAWSSGAYFGNTAPTSSVFSLDGSSYANGSGNSIVAYCWAEIAGFSKFGSYTGNGSTDGTFVYTGFRPKYILFKRTDSTGNWVLFDTARSTYNSVTKYLMPNSSNAEGDDGTGSGSWQADFLSNGFKLRAAAEATVNPSGGTIIYAAFAENPFKNSLAR